MKKIKIKKLISFEILSLVVKTTGFFLLQPHHKNHCLQAQKLRIIKIEQ